MWHRRSAITQIYVELDLWLLIYESLSAGTEERDHKISALMWKEAEGRVIAVNDTTVYI